MDRERKNRSQQKALLLLLPLAVLAAAAIILNSGAGHNLQPLLREYLNAGLRIIMPWLYVIITALLVHSRHRVLQLSIVSFDYIILITILGSIEPAAMLNPCICVISSCFAVLALRQGADDTAGGFWDEHPHLGLMLQALCAVLLPLAVFVALLAVVTQIESFVHFTFNDSLGRSLLSMIFSPIYLILQTFGFQNVVTNTALLRYQDDMMLSAFINSIMVTDFIALPALLTARSFFSSRSMRLFLILLAMCVVLGGSIGPCISLALLMLFIILPGTYSMLMICSLIFFLSSYYLAAPALVSTAVLYRPDVNLQAVFTLASLPEVKFLGLTGVLVPFIMVSLFLFVKKERLIQLGRRRSINKQGLNLKDSSSPDLTVIGLLRALGGLSNISRVGRRGSSLQIKIQDHTRLQPALLNAVCSRKPHFDRRQNTFLLDLGELGDQVAVRLTNLTAGFEPGLESSFNADFPIHPMPHIKNRLQGNT